MISDQELELIRNAVQIAYLVPFIDDVEDYVWESIWHEVKGLPDPNGLARTKRLFDIVDPAARRGWSAKTLVWSNLAVGSEFEFVIQRADVVKKCEELGFPGLTLDDPPQRLGDAVLEHWRRKVEGDALTQDVDDFRVSILLKSPARERFMVMDEELEVPTSAEIRWDWTNAKRNGLQGRSVAGEVRRFRWYPNQTQLFECLRVPATAREFALSPTRLSLQELA